MTSIALPRQAFAIGVPRNPPLVSSETSSTLASSNARTALDQLLNKRKSNSTICSGNGCGSPKPGLVSGSDTLGIIRVCGRSTPKPAIPVQAACRRAHYFVEIVSGGPGNIGVTRSVTGQRGKEPATMALVPSARPSVSDSKSARINEQGQRTIPPRATPQQSEIRGLKDKDREVTQEFDLVSSSGRGPALAPPPPPLFTLNATIERYAGLPRHDPNVLYALQMQDLPEAVVRLVQENFQLHQEVESSRSDFEELRTMNIALQEQADARLGAADDQRVELLGALEQARGELVELESQLAQKRIDHANDLEIIRQQRDALRLEIAELRSPRAKN
jgi:hypothetical protein